MFIGLSVKGDRVQGWAYYSTFLDDLGSRLVSERAWDQKSKKLDSKNKRSGGTLVQKQGNKVEQSLWIRPSYISFQSWDKMLSEMTEQLWPSQPAHQIINFSLMEALTTGATVRHLP